MFPAFALFCLLVAEVSADYWPPFPDTCDRSCQATIRECAPRCLNLKVCPPRFTSIPAQEVEPPKAKSGRSLSSSLVRPFCSNDCYTRLKNCWDNCWDDCLCCDCSDSEVDCDRDCPVDCAASCPCPPAPVCHFPMCPELWTPCPCDAHIEIINNGECGDTPPKFICDGDEWYC